jgi:hypothetical protein
VSTVKTTLENHTSQALWVTQALRRQLVLDRITAVAAPRIRRMLRMPMIRRGTRRLRCSNKSFTQSYSSANRSTSCKIRLPAPPPSCTFGRARVDRYLKAWIASKGSGQSRVRHILAKRECSQTWVQEKPAPFSQCRLSKQILMRPQCQQH